MMRDKRIEEQDQRIEEQGKQLLEKDQQLLEKDKQMEEKDQAIQSMVKLLKQSGMDPAQIAAMTGLPLEAVQQMVWKCGVRVTYQSGGFSDDTSAEKSPFVRRIRWPLRAASINVGTWAKVAKANNRPTAVKTLLSMMPIGGQMKPPMMRRILVINVM